MTDSATDRGASAVPAAVNHRPSDRAGVWRPFDELFDPKLAESIYQDEFRSPPELTRRQLLAFAGVSIPLAGVIGCRPPRQEIVPRVQSVEQLVPGKPSFYATCMTIGGVATGLLVEQHLGRPTKVEGNTDHPASLGATDIFAQASVLSLYDSDRSTAAYHGDRAISWQQAMAGIRTELSSGRLRRGLGLHLLTEPMTSPTLIDELMKLLEEYPEAVWHRYEPMHRSSVRAGAKRAFGEAVDSVYDLAGAEIVLSLDADFLGGGPGHLKYARAFGDRRRVWDQNRSDARMNRLYAVGPTPSVTGASADHWLSMRAADVSVFARAIASRLGVPFGGGMKQPAGASGEPAGSSDPLSPGVSSEWLAAIADDLKQHAGRCLVIAGDTQPAYVHALAHALNQALGNVGRTVKYIAPVHTAAEDEATSLQGLVHAIDQGQVEMLVLIECNPAYNAPADFEFARLMKQVPRKVHYGMYVDESAQLCDWHIPATHFLECWSDARAFDGTVTIGQPLIAPISNTLAPVQFVSALRGQPDRSDYDIVRGYWLGRWNKDTAHADRRWKESLHDGVVSGTGHPPVSVELLKEWWVEYADGGAAAASLRGTSGDAAELEIVFRPDPTVYDGRFANNAWLQELPKPLTKLTWDNVAVFGVATAERMGLRQEIGERGGEVVTDIIRLQYRGREVEAPAWVQPGHAEGSVTLYCGYGRTAAGKVGTGLGYNAYSLRTSDGPWFGSGLRVQKTGRRYALAATQLHHVIQGHDVLRAESLEQFKSVEREAAGGTVTASRTLSSLPVIQPHSNASPPSAPASAYPEVEYRQRRWGMVIDLSTCIGCSACVAACQAENNIPSVGKQEVSRGREMHWLRIDSYYAGPDRRQPIATYSQPVPCMHCEKAPCEVVCPVNATVHSDEGLNDMVYNRCVGTRYCANNCPYKVRRFNFFDYADPHAENLKPLRNPDVTVRSRGVMEKCTYCVQRINAARIHAEKQDRPLVQNRVGEWIKPIYPNELLTACQAVCPTRAIAFGDLNDPASEVSRMRFGQPLNYGMLAETLGTQPRTTYLTALRNPNPRIGGA